MKERVWKTFIIKNDQEITTTTIKTKKSLYKPKKESMKCHLRNVSKGKRFSTNRNFLNIIKLFLTNKCFIANSDIPLKEGNEIITTDKDLFETFNNHYVNHGVIILNRSNNS